MQLPAHTPAKKGKGSSGMLILILDELDQLRSQDCSILYRLFSLPQVLSWLSTVCCTKSQEYLYRERHWE